MKKDPGSRRALEQSVGLAFRFLFIGVAVLAVAWLASGFVSVESGSRAVVMRFGKVDRVHDSGLVWAWPRPVETVVLAPSPERQLTHEVVALDILNRNNGAVAAEVELDLRDGGYVLSGDGGVVHLSGVVTYHVNDAANYLLAQERLAPALDRLFCSSAIAAVAGRELDGVLVTRSAAEAGENAQVSAARREALRGDIRTQMNRRLMDLKLGIEISRIDLTAWLPARAKPAFDEVLTAESEAARIVAKARTDQESQRQQGERERTEVQKRAEATAKEIIAKARIATDRITALAAESSPERRALLLTRLYRERMEAILRKAGLVTLVDGTEPVRLLIPGGTVKQ